jgi:hypothetical protein
LAFLTAPALAQQQSDLGEVRLTTFNDSDKESGVWVDGEYVGYLKDFWGNRKLMLPAGEHEISVRKGGYKIFTTKVRVAAGQPVVVPVLLELDVTTQYPVGATATLKVFVNPGRAAVSIDGVFVGYASDIGGRFKSLILTPGKRHVRIELQGYRTFETDLDLAPGQTAEVRTALVKGGPELDGPARVIKAEIRDGATSLQLPAGRMYFYGMAVGSLGRSTLFSLGQYASVFHEGTFLAAAVAYGSNEVNTYETQTERHILGGVSVGGAWDTVRAFYGSNGSEGASEATANFTVERESLVVLLGLASAQQKIEIEGVPGLEVDAIHSGPDAGAAMVIGHATLPPGTYSAVARSAPLAAGADPELMADLLAVFVITSQR